MELKRHSLFFLAVLLFISLISLSYAATYDWEISDDWTVSGDWTIGGQTASESSFTLFAALITTGFSLVETASSFTFFSAFITTANVFWETAFAEKAVSFVLFESASPVSTLAFLTAVAAAISPSVIPIVDLTPFWQFLYEGDFLGTVQAVFVSAFQSADLFYGVLALLFTLPLYIRTKSLLFMSIVWILLGGLFLAAMPLVSGVAILLVTFGLAGMFFKLYMRVRG